MLSAAPVSLSVYRGQSRTGIGEGPGRPIAHGEQYLGASPELARDGELLDAIRPWLTLDSEPADHQRLGDRLEAWSYVHLRGFQWVVRLVSAGIYVGRAAYFAHGRAWPVGPAPRGFDPGLHLGRSTAFSAPWRDGQGESAPPEPPPALVRPDQIAAEPQVAAQLLAHLLQCSVRHRPLIVVAPIAEFAAGAALPGLVSFAHAALPADLKLDCRVRVYTRTPELFLGRLRTTLVALPEDSDRNAVEARPEAVVLDRQGTRMAGDALDREALAYAEAVVERAIRIPEGLTLFAERFRDHRSGAGLPAASDVRAVQLTYNLAVALAGSDEERGDLLRSYLPRAAQKAGADLDWRRLVAPEEWRAFPPESLRDLLLLDTQAFAPGAREVQRIVEDAAAEIGLTVDARLTDWWDPREPAKAGRLLELLERRPPLVSPAAAVARTVELPIRQLADLGPPAVLLAAELSHRVLSRRERESAELAELAEAPEVFAVLCSAVEQRALSPAWARAYLARARGRARVGAAKRFLDAPGFFSGRGLWEDLPLRLLDELRKGDGPPRELAPAVLRAGSRLDPVEDLAVYLRLAEVAVRIEDGGEEPESSQLVARLLADLPRLDAAADRELLVRVAFDREWRCLSPRSLLRDGELRAPWLAEMADRLVRDDDLVAALDTAALLWLGEHLEGPGNLERLCRRLDTLMARQPDATTEILVRQGWWSAWRRVSRLDAEALGRAAWEWVTSPATRDLEDPPALEDWKQVMADLPPGFTSEHLPLLRDRGRPRRLWPWIPPFEDEQVKDLCGRALDLGVLAALAEALGQDEIVGDLGRASHAYALARSRFAGQLPPGALAWLMSPRPAGLKALDLRSSTLLWENAGDRRDEALAARVSAIKAALVAGGESAREALQEAGQPNLWSLPDFLAELAEWLASQDTVEGIGDGLVAQIERSIAGEPSRRPRDPSRRLIQQLARPFPRTAHLLAPDLLHAIAETQVAEDALRALLAGQDDAPCWQELGDEIAGWTWQLGAHPLSRLAEQARRQPPAARRVLEQSGWSTFAAAASRVPALLSFREGQPQVLPAFDLAASLSGAGGLGNAALQLIFAPECRGCRTTLRWWMALVSGFRTWRRYPAGNCPDDRDDVALAVVIGWLDELDEGEKWFLWRALEAERRNFPDWTLPAEFGVG